MVVRPLVTNLSENLIKIQNFYLRKCIWKYRLRNGAHFDQARGRWVESVLMLFWTEYVHGYNTWHGDFVSVMIMSLGYRCWEIGPVFRITHLLFDFECDLVHRSDFESKGTNGLPLVKPGFEPGISGTYSPTDWMPHKKTYWVIEDQTKNLNSTTFLCNKRAPSPLDANAGIGAPLALAIYIFVLWFWMCSGTGK